MKEEKITYQFSNEKEFQEEIERCCENNRKTFDERRRAKEEELSKKDPKELEEAHNIFFRMIKDWKGIS